MISIFLCRLTDGEWCRVERIHIGHGFDSMAHAVEYAENKNRQRWPAFDWLKEPTEAYLAMRAKDRPAIIILPGEKAGDPALTTSL